MPEYRQHLFGQYSVFQSIFVSSIGITNACKDTLRTHNLTTSSRKMRDNTVSLIFFWGLAFTTLRNRKPSRFNTSAMVLGEGNCSSLYPCSLRTCKAAWAVRRV